MVWIQPFRSRDLGVLSQREIPTYNKMAAGMDPLSPQGGESRPGTERDMSQVRPFFRSLGSFLGLLVLSDFL